VKQKLLFCFSIKPLGCWLGKFTPQRLSTKTNLELCSSGTDSCNETWYVLYRNRNKSNLSVRCLSTNTNKKNNNSKRFHVFYFVFWWVWGFNFREEAGFLYLPKLCKLLVSSIHIGGKKREMGLISGFMKNFPRNP
jgi:hypothetical protein